MVFLAVAGRLIARSAPQYGRGAAARLEVSSSPNGWLVEIVVSPSAIVGRGPGVERNITLLSKTDLLLHFPASRISEIRSPKSYPIGYGAGHPREQETPHRALCQGTTLVVPQKPQNQRRALQDAEKLDSAALF